MKKISSKEVTGTRNNLPIIASLIVATLFMLPGVAYDPTNLPRLVLLTLISAWILPQLVKFIFHRFRSKSKSLEERILLVLTISYCSWAVISSIFNETARMQELLGDFGRSTGMIAYFALMGLFLWSTYSNSVIEKSSIELTFRILFHITNIYLLLQYLGLDPIEWENVYGVSIIGTVGNPNFSSIISAFSALFFSSQLLFRNSKGRVTDFVDVIGLFGSISFTLLNPSSQGTIALILGLALQVISRIPRQFRKIVIASGAGLTLLIVGLLISLIVSEKYLSISILSTNLMFRLLAWHASWKIMSDYPIFGTGFDSLGSWFTQYRDMIRAQEFLDHAYADAAHNVFLDQGVNGGIPLFLLYIAIFLFVSWRALIFLLKSNKINKDFGFLASVWFAFLFVQFISINQLGIAIIGFIVGGLLIANTREFSTSSIRKVKIGKLVSFTISVAVSLAPFQALKKDIAYLEAISSGDGSRLIEVASMWPQSDFYFARTADILYNNGFAKLGRTEAEKALKVNSRNIIALKLLVKDPNLTSEKSLIFSQRLKVLDPLGYKSIQFED